MQFIETSVFTRQLDELLCDSDYCDLQCFLATRPESGQVIRSSGGLRKLRWRNVDRGKGKRGGLRIIYHFSSEKSQIILLLIYSKSRKDDLTSIEKKILRDMIKNW